MWLSIRWRAAESEETVRAGGSLKGSLSGVGRHVWGVRDSASDVSTVESQAAAGKDLR